MPVCFVSAGPGAADLITLRGLQRLGEAAVVLHDALTDPLLRAFAPKAEWIDVGKRGFAHAVRQSEINALLVRHAQSAPGLVVRLKGGDASVFGRLEEELQALCAAGIAAEVVPGVTAALAAAAQAQRPLTRRGAGRSVALSTARARQAVNAAQGRHAACSSVSAAGTRATPFSGTTMYSLIVPSSGPPSDCVSRDRSGSPPIQVGKNIGHTRSPTDTRWTPAPTATTSPTPSDSGTSGSVPVKLP